MFKSTREKVFVAMSGGVDSSVAAALLKRQGHDITGVFIKIEAANDCDWREERRDAMRAAAVLRIPLLTLDLSREYKQSVIDYLVREYAAGRTPNPDVRCNKQIKFGAFFDEARRRGADFIATGHYARKQLLGSSCQLLASKDQNKDQTYFLWTLTPDILAHCLFPIGDYKKAEVRRLAEKFGLPNARKPDSQGLCFIGQIDFKDWLAQYLPPRPGAILNEAGKVIGEHRGIHFYTIGERHGFRVTAKTSASAPLYVVGKDVAKNILVVSNRPFVNASARKEISLNSVNWINNTPAPNKIIKTRIRYRAPLTSCRVKSLSNSRAQVTFLQPLFGPTPGQSCVFYDSRGQVCLGGGVIE